MWRYFAGEDNAFVAGAYFDEEALAMCKDVAGSIKDAGFGPVLSAFMVVYAALEADRRGRRDRASVVNFDVACHAGNIARTDGLAHGLIKQSGDNAAVYESARALKTIKDLGHTYNRAVFGEQELEMETDGVSWPAAEATILGGMRQWSEFLVVRFHRVCCSSAFAKAPESTVSNTFISTLPPVRTRPIRLFPI